MVRELIHDPISLAAKSTAATAADLGTARDLMDTLLHHREDCVGMAANMIGVQRRIIAVADGPRYLLMLNAEITKRAGPYEAEEGCLSLLGGPRKTLRYEKIHVRWQDTLFQWHEADFSGFTAQIIQHELDHCHGILI